jgi:transmembrane 9 superfamily protein 2/4
MALTASVVMLTTATVTILFTYFILCAEEHRSAFQLPNYVLHC